VISDRAVLRLERGGPLDAELAPAALYESLKARWPEIRSRAQKQVEAHFSLDQPQLPPQLPAAVTAVLKRSGELDSSMMQLAEAIGEDNSLDLLVVYLPGMDIAQHTLLGGESPAAPSELDVRLAALQRYYGFLTAITGRAVDSFQLQKRVFVVTQAGRQHEGAGILAAIGPGIRRQTRVTATVLDVAATILHALGLPAARDLDGRVVTDLFEPEFMAKYPVRHVETYGLRGAIAAARSGAPLDQEMIDRLRSLGYVR
jgi:hypothetical protein